METLQEGCETCQEEQASVVAAAVPVPVAVHKDSAMVVVAVASTAQKVFHLKKDAVGLLAAGCGACAYGPTPIFAGGGGDALAGDVDEPCDGETGSWAVHDIRWRVAAVLAAAVLQKLIQLLHVEVELLEPDVLWFHQDWPGLCLLAHKRTGKHMMTLRTDQVEVDQKKFWHA